MPTYTPGLHILAELHGVPMHQLQDSIALKVLIDALVHQHGLQNLGEVYHTFPGGGFTAVVCLSESHLSVHTWPEFGVVTYDVFLSNFKCDNSLATKHIESELKSFFGGEYSNKTLVER